MKLVIDLPEWDYKAICKYVKNKNTVNAADYYIANGTPLKTGHWIADVFLDECSVCGEQTLFFEDQQENFCPNCGCRMVEPQESEEQDADSD